MINYHNLRRIAKENKVKVDTLLALSQRNDPFYVGSKSQIRDAEWFAEIYIDMGEPREVHISRIHYQIVSKEIHKPNNEPSQNTESNWQDVSKFDALEEIHLGLIIILLVIETQFNFVDDSYIQIILENRRIQTAIEAIVKDKTKELIELLKSSELNSDFIPPQSAMIEDENDNWLFDSKLSYFDQLKKYRIFKNLLSSGSKNYEL